jgi:hypothetical protein
MLTPSVDVWALSAHFSCCCASFPAAPEALNFRELVALQLKKAGYKVLPQFVSYVGFQLQ